MNHQYQSLVLKLKEIFQINRPDLDFGIYRILNARRDEIGEFLDKRLQAKVQTALGEAKTKLDQTAIADLQKEIRDEFGRRAFDENNQLVDEEALVSDLGQKYLALTQQDCKALDDETQVYNHLLTFFSRYYDEGDFISQRRYKGDTYSIPYAGEEVMLHWANKDQYYTKSGEMFSNYRFKLEHGKSVLFRLISADTARENRKDNDKDRRFVIVTEPRTLTRVDDEGEEYEETIEPFSIVDGELTVLFEYKAFTSKTKQEELNKQSAEKILSASVLDEQWLKGLNTLEPTEKDPKRTLLDKHLSSYTQKHTADYFIHKDLGAFLNRELDFFIKNEVMHLDDVVSTAQFADIERQLSIIKCLRVIGTEIIDFLASLENFQKKLWLKKKFVVSADYCITLDRVDERLYAEIASNEKQWQQWEDLGFKSVNSNQKSDGGLFDAVWGEIGYLKQHQFMMVDTSLFDAKFKAKLLQQIDDLDKQTDGLIIHSDNFQALNNIKLKYLNKIQGVYIDPPYNTSASEIIYKNGYKHSSWLSMIYSRLETTKFLMSEEANICITIDDVELNNLCLITDDLFSNKCQLGIVPIRINPSGRPSETGFALTHEYALFYKNTDKGKISRIPRTPEQLARFKEVDERGRFEFRNLRREGSNSDRKDGERQFYPIFANLELATIRIPKMIWVEENRSWDLLEDTLPNEIIIYPINDEGREKNWRWSEESVREDYTQFLARLNKQGIPQVYYKYRPKTEGTTPLTMWTDSKYSATESGTKVLKELFKEPQFSYPKSIHAVEDCIRLIGCDKPETLCLDYFAGSGTTGHAVINLNRIDQGKRKFILVEQGEYFDTVTKPRIQKVIYASDWKSGKPLNPESGISHCLKVLKLESYEDTLNNLELVRKGAQQTFLDDNKQSSVYDNYLMNYMLEIESKDSLLNVKDFLKPFDYQMNITTDSAGAYERRHVDLVETFNYLIGMYVDYADYQLDKGYIQITGHLRTGEYTTVLWRDCERIGYHELDALLAKLKINPNDNEYQLIYINGDHNIANRYTNHDGQEKQLKIRSIEKEFLTRMFEEA